MHGIQPRDEGGRVRLEARAEGRWLHITVADTGVGATPTAVAAGEGAYWVTNADGHSVSRIDPGTTAVQTIQVGNGPSGIAIGDRGHPYSVYDFTPNRRGDGPARFFKD